MQSIVQELQLVAADVVWRVVGEARPKVLHMLGVPFQFGATFISKLVRLAVPFLVGAHQPQVVQVLQRRIERAGTGSILASRPLLQLLDYVVTVLRAVTQYIKDNISKQATLKPVLAASWLAM
jgi:hypothetical protein